MQENGITNESDLSQFRIEEHSIPLGEVSMFPAILSIVLFILPAALYGWLRSIGSLVNGFEYLFAPDLIFLGIWILLFLGGGFVRKLVWKLATSSRWSDFSAGVQWQYGYPHTAFTQPMKLSAFRVGIIVQVLLTAILPLIIAITSGHPVLALLSSVFLSRLGIDLAILLSLHGKRGNLWVTQHPSDIGCLVYEPK